MLEYSTETLQRSAMDATAEGTVEPGAHVVKPRCQPVRLQEALASKSGLRARLSSTKSCCVVAPQAPEVPRVLPGRHHWHRRLCMLRVVGGPVRRDSAVPGPRASMGRARRCAPGGPVAVRRPNGQCPATTLRVLPGSRRRVPAMCRRE